MTERIIPTETSIEDEVALRTVYPRVSKQIRDKAIDYIDEFAEQFISLSPFFCIGTGSANSFDVSPRGGKPGFVQVLDRKNMAFADLPGNNRLDTLSNLLLQPSAGMLFFIPGIDETLRINGQARISTQKELLDRFVTENKRPRSAIIITVVELYLHCSKALRRSDLWNSEKKIQRSVLPTWGQMLRNQGRTILPAKLIDFAIGQDAKRNLY
ncbi:MAG TPA: MSMEG_1061 family FMN-dependent PPOX-type flavoprotein [Afipia sp.]